MNDIAPKAPKPPIIVSTPSPRRESSGGSRSGLILLPAFLIATSIGGSYLIEQNEQVETFLRTYNLQFLLDGAAPLRELLRKVGHGRPSSQEIEVDSDTSPPSPESSSDLKQEEQQVVDPYAVDEKKSAEELHTDALEDLAHDLLAHIHEQERRNDFIIYPDQVDEARALLLRLSNALDREKAQKIQLSKPIVAPVPTQVPEASPKEEVAPPVEVHNELNSSPSVVVVPGDHSKLLDVRRSALEEVLEGLAQQTQTLRSDTERSLALDLEHLDERALRYRIAQLTTEFFERIKWEGLRQQQALQQAEALLASRYSDLLTQQRNELVLESEKKVFELEKSLRVESQRALDDLHVAQESRLHKALVEQHDSLKTQFTQELEKVQTSITQALKEEHTHEVALIKEARVKSMIEVNQHLKATNGEIAAIRKFVDSEFDKVTVSTAAHALSAAVLIAEEALLKNAPAEEVIKSLQKFSASEPLVSAIVQTLPRTASKNGVPVLADIRLRFAVVREEARKAALAPEGTNPIVAQMIGNFLSFVSIKPTGNVSGESVEATLARIDFYLDLNRLDLALLETQNVRGYPRTLMTDWEVMLRDRLVVDQAIRSLKTVSALRHLELS